MATQTETISIELRPVATSEPDINVDDNDSKSSSITNGKNRPQDHDTEIPNSGIIADDESNYPTGAKFWLICLAIGLVLLAGGLEASIVSTAVPAITDHFHTIADVGWYAAAYQLCACAFQFAFGKAYKLFSAKRVFLISTSIFCLGSLLCASAATSKMFVLGRAVAGLGTSGVIAGCFAIVIQTVPLRRRPIFISFFQATESISIIVGPILGGILTQNIGWRWCFWIILPVGGIAIIAIMLCLSNPPSTPSSSMSWKEVIQQLDIVGNLVFVPALTCLFLALSWAGVKYSWSDPKVIAVLVLFTILFAVFMLDQYLKGDAATIPLRVLFDRNVLAGFWFTFCARAAMMTAEYYYPTYIQVVKGKSVAESGYLLLPIILGYITGALILGGATSVLGYYTPFMLLTSLLLPIGAGLLTTLKPSTNLAQLITYPGLAGFAAGIGGQAPATAVQVTLPAADVQLGLAVILFAQFFGGAVMVSIAQTIFVSRLGANLKDLAPGLDAARIEQLGLTDIKKSVGKEYLDEVVLVFDKSLAQTWYLTVGLACATIVGSVAMEWKSVKQKMN